MAETAGRNLAQVFAENVQRKRKLLGLTQEDLAERLGIGQQSMSRMERGVMAPKFDRLEDIARELHCSVAALFVDAHAGRADTQDCGDGYSGGTVGYGTGVCAEVCD